MGCGKRVVWLSLLPASPFSSSLICSVSEPSWTTGTRLVAIQYLVRFGWGWSSAPGRVLLSSLCPLVEMAVLPGYIQGNRRRRGQ